MLSQNKHITIATANIYFGGMTVHDNPLTVLDWLTAHFVSVQLQSEFLMRYFLKLNTSNPLEKIVKGYYPDILIVNEVYPYMNSSVIKYLKKHYKTIKYTVGTIRPKDIKSATLIATKFEGTPFPVSMGKDKSGGACGLYISELNTSVIAFHPEALYSNIRARQLKNIAKVIEKRFKKGHFVIAGGDCNCEFSEMVRADKRFKTLPMQVCSVPSFPSQTVMKRLNRPWWYMLRLFVKARKGQRAIDNVFIPDNWKVVSCQSVETTSDHEAVVLKAKI